MHSLEPRDSFHLEAAQGWLELGITARLRAHPDVSFPGFCVSFGSGRVVVFSFAFFPSTASLGVSGSGSFKGTDSIGGPSFNRCQ